MAKDPTTRRGVHRGLVRVTEWLAKRQGDDPHPEQTWGPRDRPLLPASPSWGATDTGQMFVTDLLRRERQTGEQSPPSGRFGLYGLLALATGAVLLTGAVTASAVALVGPRIERAVPGSTPSAIEGADTLRPDLLNKSIAYPPPPAAASSQDTAGTSATPNRPAGKANGPAQPEPQPVPESGQPGLEQDDPQPEPNSAAVPPAAADEEQQGSVLPELGIDPDLDPIVRTVTSFYGSVGSTPQQAFSMLGPQMQGSGYQDFQNAWAGVERITVDDIRRDGPNAVLVTATIEQTDGNVLHTLQRVLVTPGAQPRITDAALLSAARN